MATEAESRKERKERFEAVVRVIDYQTSPNQMPGCRPATVKLLLAGQGRYTVDGVESSLQAAIENDAVFTWRDSDGRRRHTRREKDDLQRLSAYVAEELQQPEKLERINAALVEVKDDG